MGRWQGAKQERWGIRGVGKGEEGKGPGGYSRGIWTTRRDVVLDLKEASCVREDSKARKGYMGEILEISDYRPDLNTTKRCPITSRLLSTDF